MAGKILKAAVLDMQPIDPPVGGGRLRLLGLYHALGKNMPTTYVGTYDWPGEKFREHYLSDTLREIDVPLSKAHFAASGELKQKVGGKTVIDTAFHQQAHLSPEYIERARKELPDADIVIFSHPWIYPLVKYDIDNSRQLMVYDSHNVEGFLRYTLLDDNGGAGTEIVREAVRAEYELCRFADIILACSHEDRELFHKLYNVPFEKIRIAPNGVFTSRITPPAPETRSGLKNELGLGRKPCAIFIGSPYPPNVEASNFICDTLAPSLPEVTFIIAGGVGSELRTTAPNVRLTGFLDDEMKLKYLQASDMAVNPMFSGSGTNIKMFDFMAAGLPIVSTPVGARGIDPGSGGFLTVREKDGFASGIKKLLEVPEGLSRSSGLARSFVEQKYSFERISADLGMMLGRFHSRKKSGPPFFSVVVPSYERPEHLFRLLDALRAQTFRDFEVIVVDQSKDAFAGRDEDSGCELFYIHTDVKGAVKARNKGAFFATGKVLAYIDDDCIPSKDWLEGARRYFDRPEVVGVEGLIESDKIGDPDYRTVTNKGWGGIGFMTANLFVRTEVFNAINGFDEGFDNPHFREDTDMGWMMLKFGEIPFGRDVQVFHPPHKRDIARESLSERNRFFEKDALLLKKHPERYKDLFLREGHWKNTPGFWENFLRGADKYQVELEAYDFLKPYMPIAGNGSGAGHKTGQIPSLLKEKK